jgi:hypothetical protein
MNLVHVFPPLLGFSLVQAIVAVNLFYFTGSASDPQKFAGAIRVVARSKGQTTHSFELQFCHPLFPDLLSFSALNLLARGKLSRQTNGLQASMSIRLMIKSPFSHFSGGRRGSIETRNLKNLAQQSSRSQALFSGFFAKKPASRNFSTASMAGRSLMGKRIAGSRELFS